MNWATPESLANWSTLVGNTKNEPVSIRFSTLPPFAAAVKAGARTVMVNSAEINGVPGHINKHLLTDVLKTELGYNYYKQAKYNGALKLLHEAQASSKEYELTQLFGVQELYYGKIYETQNEFDRSISPTKW